MQIHSQILDYSMHNSGRVLTQTAHTRQELYKIATAKCRNICLNYTDPATLILSINPTELELVPAWINLETYTRILTDRIGKGKE